MSKNLEFCDGVYHLHIKLSGIPENIMLFHHVMASVESDWPWLSLTKTHITMMMCQECHGVTIQNPRVAPQDIKAAAMQCGVKCKIYQYAPGDKCKSRVKMYISPCDRSKLYTCKPSRISFVAGNVIIDGTVADDDEGEETVEEGLAVVTPESQILVN